MKKFSNNLLVPELKLLGFVASKTNAPLMADYSGVETEKCKAKMEKCLADTIDSQNPPGYLEILDLLTDLATSEWQRLFLLSLDEDSSERIVALALETGDGASMEEKERTSSDFREWCETSMYLNLKLGTVPRNLPQKLFRIHLQVLAFTSSFSYQDVKREMESSKKFSPAGAGWIPSKTFIVANRAFFKSWTTLEMQRNPLKGFYMFALERDTLIARSRDLTLPRSIYTDAVVASLSQFPRGPEREQLEKWLTPNEKFSEEERKLYVRTRARK